MSATTVIQDLLTRYGLNFGPSQVQEWVSLYDVDPDNITIIMDEITSSQQYLERFPGIQQRIDNGYNPIDAEDYIELESQYRSIIRNTGLPEHFYDEPHEIAELISNDVAPTEFESRVVDGFLAARDAPDEVKQALAEFYGITNADGALAAYFLDPDKGEQAIQKEFESAQIGGAARLAGGYSISQQQAEELQALGITMDQAAGGFNQIRGDEGVTSQNLGRGRQFTMDELMSSYFGNNAQVQEQIRRQREQRVSEFEGSSGGGLTNSGILGLADADRSQ